MPRSRRFSAEQWFKHKDLIQRLWIEEDRTFTEVAVELAKEQFSPTKRQFEFQVGKWGWYKYTKSRDKETLIRQHETLSASQQVEAIFGENNSIVCNNKLLSRRNFLRWRNRSAKQSSQDVEKHATNKSPSSGETLNTAVDYDFPPIIASTISLEQRHIKAGQTRRSDARTTRISQNEGFQFLGIDETCRSAYDAQLRCDYATAELQYRAAAQRWHAGLCPQDGRIFSIYRQIAVCLINKGDVKEAYEVICPLYEITSPVLEKTDYQRLNILRTMAATNEAMGNLKLAEQQHQAVLQVAIQNFGLTDNLTLAAMAGFASIMRVQNRLVESRRLYSKVLKLRETNHSDDFDVCQELRQLADVLSDSGDVSESIQLYQTAEQKAIISLGEQHHITLRIQSNLAADLRIAGHLDDSGQLLYATFTAQKAFLGNDHPDAFWTSYQYAKCLMTAGRYDEALPWLENVLAHRRQRLGEVNIRTLNCYIWIGWCSECVHQTDAALAYYQHVLGILRQTSTFERYSDTYRVRWLEQAVSRTASLTCSASDVDILLGRASCEATQPLEMANRDGSPVQCVIEEESDCPETCAVVN